MENPRSYGYEDGTVTGIPPQAPHAGVVPPAQYKFSPEEMRVLKECNAESFAQRSAPLSTVLGLATYFGIQKGHLKPSPRFGAFPKVSLAVIVGYFLGKISYQQACAEKLMALPNSYIGQLLRDKRDGKLGSSQPKFPHKSTLGVTSDDIYSDAGPGNALDLDTDRPNFSDDSYRAGSDIGQSLEQRDDIPPQPSMSYEELRRKNRGQYTEARKDPYKVDPNQMPTIRRPPPSSSPSAPTNKYGDVME